MDGMDKSAEGKPSPDPEPKEKKPCALDSLRGVFGR